MKILSRFIHRIPVCPIDLCAREIVWVFSRLLLSVTVVWTSREYVSVGMSIGCAVAYE